MQESTPLPPEQCQHCPGCGAEIHAAEQTPDCLPLTGCRLGLTAAGLYLGPLALAICGAILGGDSPNGQFLGAMTGLGVGIIVAIISVRLLHRTAVRRDNPGCPAFDPPTDLTMDQAGPDHPADEDTP